MSSYRSRSRSPMNNMDYKRDSKSTGRKSGLSDCRVFVSNIPYDCRWQELKDLLRDEVGNVSFVEFFDDDTGRPRGTAVVDFESRSLAEQCVDKINRIEFKGRQLVFKLTIVIEDNSIYVVYCAYFGGNQKSLPILVPKRGDALRSRDFAFLANERDQGGRHEDRRNGSMGGNVSYGSSDGSKFGNTYGLSTQFLDSLGINGPLVNKIFVGNIDYKVTDDDLKELFQTAGKVISAEIAKDDERKSRGFAVVEFDHPFQAVQAISMLNGQYYFDRKLGIHLDRVAEREKMDPKRKKLPHGLKSIGLGLGVNGEAILDISDIPTVPQTQSHQNTSLNFGSLLANNPIANANPNLLGSVDPLTLALGLGASNMLSMGAGHNLGNMDVGLMNTSGGGGGYGSHVGSGGGSGYSNQNSRRSGGGADGNRFQQNKNYSNNSGGSSEEGGVDIFNLPLDYTWRELKDMARKFGDVRFAEIKMKGVGRVRFSNSNEASRAVENLDNLKVDGKYLRANLA